MTSQRVRNELRRVTAVIPARGGSKGIPRKNLSVVNGTTLLARTIVFAQQSGLFDHVHVSTDDTDIAAEAERFGAKPNFLRSEESSHDRASSTDVLIEVDRRLTDQGQTTDVYVLLEPTSPMRETHHVRDSLDLIHRGFDAAVTVSPVDVKFHPDKQFRVESGGDAAFFTERGPTIVARQQLETTYIRNGFCYAVTSEVLRSHRSIFGTRLGAVVCDVPYVNIDSPEDLARCRELLV